VVLANVLQAAIGCMNHRYMAPSRPGIHPAASLAYLPFGSTAMWLHCYTALSFLPFPLELLKAALCCMVLVASSPHLCGTSWGLRAGYATLHAGLARPVRHGARQMLAALRPALDAAAAVARACGATCEKLAAAAAAGASQHDTDTAVCLQYQTPVLLLLGFVGATWVVHRAERRLRTDFLRSCCERGEKEQRAAPPQGPGRQQPLQRAALQAAAAQELAAPLPSDLEFLICFALPGIFCILLVAV
jgi:hypothetical protein